MSQVFDGEGKVTPVTVVSADPNVVLQVKNKEKDGYEAVQLGFGIRKVKNIKKPQQGQFGKFGNFRYVREFRNREIPNPKSQTLVTKLIFLFLRKATW